MAKLVLREFSGRPGWHKITVMADIRKENEALKKEVESLRKRLGSLTETKKQVEVRLEDKIEIIAKLREEIANRKEGIFQ